MHNVNNAYHIVSLTSQITRKLPRKQTVTSETFQCMFFYTNILTPDEWNSLSLTLFLPIWGQSMIRKDS